VVSLEIDHSVMRQRLFTNDVLVRFVSSQSQEDWLTKLVVAGPLGKLDLGDQQGFDPNTAFHDRRGNALTPASGLPSSGL